MKTLRIIKGCVSTTVLILFLFSGNGFSYGAHFIEELGHDNHETASHSAADEASAYGSSTAAAHHHDGGQGTDHKECVSCCDSHSHISIPCQPIFCSHSPRLITRLTCEPYDSVPEVYLDKFIPPQNLS